MTSLKMCILVMLEVNCTLISKILLGDNSGLHILHFYDIKGSIRVIGGFHIGE